MSIRRRRVALALAAAIALTSLAACGGPDASDGEPGAVGSPTDGNPTDGNPADDARTIEDQYGTVTVTGVPTRVVTPGNPETDTTLALGVVPVAMGQWFDEEDGSSLWRRELLDGEQPEIIRYNPDGYDVEETLAFQPDLVIAGYDLEENPYNALSAVVPTLSMPYETSGEDLTRAIGVALGRQDEAEALITETRERVEETRAAHPVLDGLRVAIVDGSTPGVLYEASTSTIGLGMLEQLGIRPAEGVAGLEDYAEVPAERWSVFDGDLLVVNFADESTRQQLEANELFQRIPAVAAGRYLSITDLNEGELLRATALPQVQYSLEHFVPKLAAAAGS